MQPRNSCVYVWLIQVNWLAVAGAVNASASGATPALSIFHRSLPPPLKTMSSLKPLVCCQATSLVTSAGVIRMSGVVVVGSMHPSPGVQWPVALHRLSARNVVNLRREVVAVIAEVD